MKCLFVVVTILSILPSLLVASPLRDENEGTSIRETLNSFLRIRRQSSVFTCTTDQSCQSDPAISAPPSLVQCFQSRCECADCFMLDEQGQCSSTLCPDFQYNNGSGVCATDQRQTQLTAFLLSLFLSSTGAANFYIGQSALGGGQIFLLLLLLAMSYAMCCFPCCLACCMDDVKGSIIFIILMLVFVLVTVVVSLMIWAWWIADVIIFATNQRLAGTGCILTPNL